MIEKIYIFNDQPIFVIGGRSYILTAVHTHTIIHTHLPVNRIEFVTNCLIIAGSFIAACAGANIKRRIDDHHLNIGIRTESFCTCSLH